VLLNLILAILLYFPVLSKEKLQCMPNPKPLPYAVLRSPLCL
jgi:hypothetical protein